MRRAIYAVAMPVAASMLVVGLASQQNASIIWEPERLDTAVFRGGAREIEVRLQTTLPLESVELFVVPELAPYVEVMGDRLRRMENEVTIRLLISLPPTANFKTIEGTIHVRQGKRTIAKPLPVAVRVVDPEDATQGLEDFLLAQFGTTTPVVGSEIDPPQAVVDQLLEGSNLPVVLKAGSLRFLGSMRLADPPFRDASGILFSFLAERTF